MKKIFIIFALIFSIFVSNQVFAGSWDPNSPDFVWPPAPSTTTNETTSSTTSTTGCKYNEQSDLSGFLDGCKPKTVVWGTNMRVDGWFKSKINQWIANISLVLWVAAVGALVYAALLLQFANWEDEKIKKAKDIIKWTMIWFLLLISASGFIYVVINVMFGLWWQ